jgi:hypothetical protein
MDDSGKTKERLLAELARLRQKLADLEASESPRHTAEITRNAAVSEMPAAGSVPGVGMSRDVTERIRAEAAAEVKRLNDEIQLQRMRVFKATMRTVQGIVNNLLNELQLVHLEAAGHVPAEVLAVVDRAIQEAAVKLTTLADLETVTEKEMALGLGIDYPGAGS